MVKKLLHYLQKEVKGLHHAAYLLGTFSLISQALAFLRDRLLAGTFGASATLDVYYAAFRIPDFIFVVVGSVVSLSVLIPFLAERIDADFDDAKRFVAQVFTFFFGVIVVSAVVAFCALPWVVSFVFPGFSGESLETLVVTSRILLLSPILLGISNILGSITQIHKRFFIYALSPVVYNVGIILGVVFLAPHWGVPGLALGVIGGACMHMLIQVPFALRSGLFPHLVRRLDLSVMVRVLKLSLPRTITLGSTHLMLLVFVGLASLMVEGSISVFNLSYNLQNAPVAVIGVSYSLAAFPTLSQLFVGKQTKKFVGYIVTALRHIVFWTVPASVLLIVLRAHVVRVILGAGEFSWSDTRLTAAALALFSLSLMFQGITLLLVRAYYSAGETRKPLLFAVTAMVCGVGGAFGLSLWYEGSDTVRSFVESLFRVDSVAGTDVLVLVFAFSCASMVNACALLWSFQRDFGNVLQPVLRVFGEVFSASVIAGGVTWGCLQLLPPVISLETFWGVLGQGLVAGLCGIGCGVLILAWLGSDELREIRKACEKRMWKSTDIVGPDAEVV